MNPIANVGLELFGSNYEKVEGLEAADAVLVRSTAMHDFDIPNLYVSRNGHLYTAASLHG